MSSRRLKLAAIAPVFATILATFRWSTQQATGNLYTETDHRYYVPDPDLGWRYVEEGHVWLGLDAIGLVAVLAVVVLFLLRRLLRNGDPSPRAKAGLWVLSVATLLVPFSAFKSGLPPDDASHERPDSFVEAPTEGIAAGLPGLEAGTYTVLDDAELSSAIATISAGGETFEARFGGMQGTFTGNPGDLSQPIEATFTADPRTVDTGVDLRSEHAGEYLQIESFETMELALDGIEASAASEDGSVAFSAKGRLNFIGDELPMPITGSAKTLDAAACERLGIEATVALKISAKLTVAIADTKLSPHATDFSADQIPIVVELVLVPTPS